MSPSPPKSASPSAPTIRLNREAIRVFIACGLLLVVAIAEVAVFRPGLGWVIAIGALLAARLSLTTPIPRNLVALPALAAAGIAIGLGASNGWLLEALILAGGIAHGLCFAALRRLKVSLAGAAYGGLLAFFACVLGGSAIVETTTSNNAKPVFAAGTLQGEIAAREEAMLDRWRASLAPLQFASAAFRTRYAENLKQPELPLKSEDATKALARFYAALYAMGSLLFALGIGVRGGLRTSDALARGFRATERQMPFLIGALVFYIMAGRAAEPERWAVYAEPVAWGFASLVWLQALAVQVWMWRQARFQGKKELYFLSAGGAIILVLAPLAGFLIGLCDVYLDFRKTKATA